MPLGLGGLSKPCTPDYVYAREILMESSLSFFLNFPSFVINLWKHIITLDIIILFYWMSIVCQPPCWTPSPWYHFILTHSGEEGTEPGKPVWIARGHSHRADESKSKHASCWFRSPYSSHSAGCLTGKDRMAWLLFGQCLSSYSGTLYYELTSGTQTCQHPSSESTGDLAGLHSKCWKSPGHVWLRVAFQSPCVFKLSA